MLTSQELRIGNLLYYHLTEDVCEVNYIGEKSFDCKTELGSMAHGVYDPIPLTERWFHILGLDKSDEGDYYEIQIGNNLNLTIDAGDLTAGIALQWRAQGSNIFGKALYVHQLQNLYFSLSSEELKLNISSSAGL